MTASGAINPKKNGDSGKEKKRKMSESHMRLRGVPGGKESGTTSVNGHHAGDARPIGSRGASRGNGTGTIGVIQSRSGLNSQMGVAGPQHVSFSKALDKEKRLRKRATVNNESSAVRNKADSQLESEGEAGDTGVYAQWAGSTVDGSRPNKPLPKFEKSVFDMNYQKGAGTQQTPNNWRNKDVGKS